MDLRESLYLYKETRVNLEPPSPAAVVNLRLPSSDGGRRVVTAKTNGSSTGSDNFAEEERAYRVKNLATSSSIFHRKYHGSPRSFLWRILDRGNILSIRAVDLCKDENAPDANLILHIHFPKPVRPSCVAFADPAQHDALCLFALDESFSLHHLVVRPDVFRKRAATDQGLAEASRPYLSPVFGFKVPHRLVAVSADEFVVTLQDGGIVAFRRDGHESPEWKESSHSPVSFVQGLRSILPFQGGPTVKHGGTTMEITAAASAVVTSMDLDDTAYLFTVCLDHRMRIWSLSRGEIAATGDILGLQRDAHDVGKWTVDPSQANLVRTAGLEEGTCLCITYSPVGAGAFKFWKVTALPGEKVGVEPYFEPDQPPLTPPTPSSSEVWTLADFGVSYSVHGGLIGLWILWKNNLVYRVTKLECSRDNIDRSWSSDWVSVFTDNSTPTAQSSGPWDPTDPTERWLQLMFFPGRFAKATLETALTMYERGLVGSAKDVVSKGGGMSLAESISLVLGSAATLEKSSAGTGMDYDQFRSTSETQWRRFYRLVVELDKQRGEALSLVLDPSSGLAWTVCADFIAAIRDCSSLDRVYHNLSAPVSGNENVASLLTAATTFLDGFSDGMSQLCESTLRAELFEDSSKTDPERLQFISDKAGFWRQVTEEDCSNVIDLLGENFKAVDLVLYDQLFSLVEQTQDAYDRDVRHPFTQFGRKLVIKGIQDTAELHWQILFGQLILLVHMEFEFDRDEDALHSRFDIGSVYRRMIQALKRLELVRWLAKSEFSVALSKSERSSFSGSPTSFRRGFGETQIMTALEGSVGHLLGLGDLVGGMLASRISDLISDICAPDSTVELDPAMIQCMLLKRDRPDLALELASFANHNPFSAYVRGRVFLALRDHDAAALHFRKAAVGLSVPMRHPTRHSAGLIDDVEWNLFYSGPANYYSHIVALYDKQKAYSYVVDFARLSLQFHQDDEPTTRAEMLSRLFTAATASSRFELAHSTLMRMTNTALQHSCLKKLVERMCETLQTADLIALPFPGLQQAVDEIIYRRSREVVDVTRGCPWHMILYSLRISRNNYRGAAAALLGRLNKLQQAGEGDKPAGYDVLDTPVTKMYLMLINTLSCVEPKQAWISADEDPARSVGSGHGAMDAELHHVDGAAAGEDAGGGDNGGPLSLLVSKKRASIEVSRRKVLSLADIRKQYQDELDRIAAIQNNQFEFDAEDVAMDD